MRSGEEYMHKKIVIDHNKCTGCYMCGQGCSLVKTGTINPAASRIRIVDFEDTGVNVPILCQHCVEPVCVPSCPEGAITRDAGTGIVRIDESLCDNCSICRKVCPYAGPVFSAAEKRVVLCDHCGGEPTCVIVCPTGALTYEEYDPEAPGQRLQGMEEARETVMKKERQK
jgi:anaerobic carbon-monoxide dehydrogenase iron sulfur subunit